MPWGMGPCWIFPSWGWGLFAIFHVVFNLLILGIIIYIVFRIFSKSSFSGRDKEINELKKEIGELKNLIKNSKGG